MYIAMPKAVQKVAIQTNIQDVCCPTCGDHYAKRQSDGTVGLYRPCQHLIAHLGPFGWEVAPDHATTQTSGFQAAKAFQAIASHGLVTHVQSGTNDHDWLVWKQPATTAALTCHHNVSPVPAACDGKAA
jgi:hypothetical protein